VSASVNSPHTVSGFTPPRPTVLIVTDVFGNTPAVSGLIRQLDINAIVVSPWEDEDCGYRSEQDAYQAFIVEGGIARYANKLLAVLREQDALDFAIGFSAGASALWINSEDESMRTIQNAVLFYGSRIRDYRAIKPVCPTRLIFAEQEAAFAPSEVVSELNRSGHHAEIAKGTKHGFMNAYSRGCCVKSQTRYTAELVALIHASSKKAAA